MLSNAVVYFFPFPVRAQLVFARKYSQLTKGPKTLGNWPTGCPCRARDPRVNEVSHTRKHDHSTWGSQTGVAQHIQIDSQVMEHCHFLAEFQSISCCKAMRRRGASHALLHHKKASRGRWAKRVRGSIQRWTRGIHHLQNCLPGGCGDTHSNCTAISPPPCGLW